MLNPLARHRARCRETRAQMSDYLDGDLSAAAARRLERHTAWCPNCAHMLKNLRRTVDGLQALRDLPPDDSH
ncbi:MAG: anti-sigma factor family protein [Solirubrobacteraceae bacterium]